MGFSENCTKGIIVITNFIFFAFGCAILGIGIYLKIRWDDIKDAYTDDSDVDLGLGYISLIVLGVFIVLIALSGCLGACFRSKCLLGTYGVVVIVLLIAEIGVTIAVATNAFGATDKIKEEMTKSLKGFKEDLSDSHSEGWAAMFDLFDCCGVTDNPVEDFKNAAWEKSKLRTSGNFSGKAEFPVACCIAFKYKDGVNQKVFENENIKKCLKETKPNKETAYVQGCEAKFDDFLSDNKGIVIGVSCGLFAVQLGIAIMAFCLMRDEDD